MAKIVGAYLFSTHAHSHAITEGRGGFAAKQIRTYEFLLSRVLPYLDRGKVCLYTLAVPATEGVKLQANLVFL